MALEWMLMENGIWDKLPKNVKIVENEWKLLEVVYKSCLKKKLFTKKKLFMKLLEAKLHSKQILPMQGIGHLQGGFGFSIIFSLSSKVR